MMKMEHIIISEERNVTLAAYIQDVGGEYRSVTARPAIVILPGGAYQICSDREAEPVVWPFLKAGYDAFVLRYSVKEHAKWPQPLEDFEEAMEIISRHAKDWHVLTDKIAVIGFSAGGHLAGACATMARHRPAAAILGYALLTEDIREFHASAPTITEQVDDSTCPCFLFGTRNDCTVPIRNSIEMMSALDRYNITFESHIYSFGPHGFSTADSSIQNLDSGITVRASEWVQDSIGWLREILGDFGPEGMTKPLCKQKVNDDNGAWLSLDCTIGRLWGNPEALRILEPVIQEMKEKIEPFSPDMTFEDMMHALSKMKLKELLNERNICRHMFEEIDEQLGKVPNI